MKALLTAVTVAILAQGAGASAGPQSGPGSPGAAGVTATVDIQVCNRSGRNATVAVSYVEPGAGEFVNRGWYDVSDGACAQLASTDNANFYLYADATDGSGQIWGGDHTLCVEYPGPYRFLSTGSSGCEAGQETRSFLPVHAEKPGPYVWTLHPK